MILHVKINQKKKKITFERNKVSFSKKLSLKIVSNIHALDSN